MAATSDSTRLANVLAAIDEVNAGDPNRIGTAAGNRPAELVYGERMSATLARFAPAPSPELQIAVRAQHIARWKLPRSDYPEGKAGYHRWRTEQKRRHATLVGDIMAPYGFGAEAAARVGAIVRKENLKNDAEAQTLEDVACLVFLEHYLADFAAKHTPDKLTDILRKTWAKMSPAAHQAASQVPFPKPLHDLVVAAVSP